MLLLKTLTQLGLRAEVSMRALPYKFKITRPVKKSTIRSTFLFWVKLSGFYTIVKGHLRAASVPVGPLHVTPIGKQN